MAVITNLQEARHRRFAILWHSVRAVLLLVVAALPQHGARGQLLMRYLPQSVPGYQLDPTLAVLQNGGPDYTSTGVRLGSFTIRPGIDETFGYNDNPLGLANARPSAVIGSAGSVAVNSDWSRDSIGASVNVDDLRYPGVPIADQTSYSAFAGGRLDIGRDSLDVSGGHVSTDLGPTDVLSRGFSAPIPYSSDDVRAAYVARFNRLTLTPAVNFTTYSFGHSGSGAAYVDDSVQDNNQVLGGVTAAYELSPGHNIVAAVQETGAFYLHRGAGAPGSHYTDDLFLAGLDYDTQAAFHYDVLAGYETRDSSGGAHPTRQTPAVEVSVTWRPTLLTTLNAAAVRHLSDASYDVTNNLAYSEGKVVLYHELYRNIILNGNVDYQATQGGQDSGGNRNSLTTGAGATYLLNRRVRLNLDYQFAQGSGFQPGFSNSGLNSLQVNNRSFESNLIQWSVHLGF